MELWSLPTSKREREVKEQERQRVVSVFILRLIDTARIKHCIVTRIAILTNDDDDIHIT